MATTERLFIDKAVALEKRNSRISAGITSVIMIVLLFLSFIMLLDLYRDTKIGEGDEFEVVGSIDFGNRTNGSKRVNNYKPPVENPTPVNQPKPNTTKPAASNNVTKTETPPKPVPSKTTPSEVVTTNESSPVNTTPTETKPKEETPVKPKETTTQNTTSTDNASTANNNTSEEADDGLDFSMDGSNEGDAKTGTGNQGTPTTDVLDPDGLYKWGDEKGAGSLAGRQPVKLDKPDHTCQQEGRITFKFIINPDGSVAFANPDGPVPPNMQCLVKAGRKGLMRWKFSKGTRQTVKVTITFKLT